MLKSFRRLCVMYCIFTLNYRLRECDLRAKTIDQAFIRLSCCSWRIMQELFTDKKRCRCRVQTWYAVVRPSSCRASRDEEHFTYILVLISYVLLLFLVVFFARLAVYLAFVVPRTLICITFHWKNPLSVVRLGVRKRRDWLRCLCVRWQVSWQHN